MLPAWPHWLVAALCALSWSPCLAEERWSAPAPAPRSLEDLDSAESEWVPLSAPCPTCKPHHAAAAAASSIVDDDVGLTPPKAPVVPRQIFSARQPSFFPQDFSSGSPFFPAGPQPKQVFPQTPGAQPANHFLQQIGIPDNLQQFILTPPKQDFPLPNVQQVLLGQQQQQQQQSAFGQSLVPFSLPHNAPPPPQPPQPPQRPAPPPPPPPPPQPLPAFNSSLQDNRDQKEEVQLLYVPVETLRQRGHFNQRFPTQSQPQAQPSQLQPQQSAPAPPRAQSHVLQYHPQSPQGQFSLSLNHPTFQHFPQQQQQPPQQHSFQHLPPPQQHNFQHFPQQPQQQQFQFQQFPQFPQFPSFPQTQHRFGLPSTPAPAPQHHFSFVQTPPQTAAPLPSPSPSTTPAPHQPPLSVYMSPNGHQDTKISDVLQLLKNARTIPVLDNVSPDSPQVFVGPANLHPPKGYAKFELPYLSSLDTNRVERKVNKLPFFVAPLSFQPPPGYSKILLPPPHIGSVVVNSNVTVVPATASTPQLHDKDVPVTKRPTVSSSVTFSLPSEITPVNPRLPTLVNSLDEGRPLSTADLRPSTTPITPARTTPRRQPFARPKPQTVTLSPPSTTPATRSTPRPSTPSVEVESNQGFSTATLASLASASPDQSDPSFQSQRVSQQPTSSGKRSRQRLRNQQHRFNNQVDDQAVKSSTERAFVQNEISDSTAFQQTLSPTTESPPPRFSPENVNLQQQRVAFPTERPSFSDRPTFQTDRPNFSERPTFLTERPNFSERPALQTDRPNLNERPRFQQTDRPTLNERPRFQQTDRPNFSERPAFQTEGPNFSERPAFQQTDAPNFSERPAFQTDRPDFNGRPTFHQTDRPNFSERPVLQQTDRPSFSERPVLQQTDRPSFSERPLIPQTERPDFIERPAIQTDRPNFIEHSERPQLFHPQNQLHPSSLHGFLQVTQQEQENQLQDFAPAMLDGGKVQYQYNVQGEQQVPDYQPTFVRVRGRIHGLQRQPEETQPQSQPEQPSLLPHVPLELQKAVRVNPPTQTAPQAEDFTAFNRVRSQQHQVQDTTVSAQEPHTNPAIAVRVRGKIRTRPRHPQEQERPTTPVPQPQPQPAQDSAVSPATQPEQVSYATTPHHLEDTSVTQQVSEEPQQETTQPSTSTTRAGVRKYNNFVRTGVRRPGRPGGTAPTTTTTTTTQRPRGTRRPLQQPQQQGQSQRGRVRRPIPVAATGPATEPTSAATEPAAEHHSTIEHFGRRRGQTRLTPSAISNEVLDSDHQESVQPQRSTVQRLDSTRRRQPLVQTQPQPQEDSAPASEQPGRVRVRRPGHRRQPTQPAQPTGSDQSQSDSKLSYSLDDTDLGKDSQYGEKQSVAPLPAVTAQDADLTPPSAAPIPSLEAHPSFDWSAHAGSVLKNGWSATNAGATQPLPPIEYTGLGLDQPQAQGEVDAKPSDHVDDPNDYLEPHRGARPGVTSISAQDVDTVMKALEEVGLLDGPSSSIAPSAETSVSDDILKENVHKKAIDPSTQKKQGSGTGRRRGSWVRVRVKRPRDGLATAESQNSGSFPGNVLAVPSDPSLDKDSVFEKGASLIEDLPAPTTTGASYTPDAVTIQEEESPASTPRISSLSISSAAASHPEEEDDVATAADPSKAPILEPSPEPERQPEAPTSTSEPAPAPSTFIPVTSESVDDGDLPKVSTTTSTPEPFEEVTSTVTTTTPGPSQVKEQLKKQQEQEQLSKFLGSTTSTKVSMETEICFRGRCIKTKGTKDQSQQNNQSDQTPTE